MNLCRANDGPFRNVGHGLTFSEPWLDTLRSGQRCTHRSRTAHDERAFSLLISGFRTLRGRQEEIFWVTVGPGGNNVQMLRARVRCLLHRLVYDWAKGHTRQW